MKPPERSREIRTFSSTGADRFGNLLIDSQPTVGPGEMARAHRGGPRQQAGYGRGQGCSSRREGARQGSMKNHRIISHSCAAAAVVLLAFPVAAQAGSSLLSGYGGPGEGNQALLGSALVNGHRGGGSSGGGSAGQGSSSGEASATGASEVQSGASPGQAAKSAGKASSGAGSSGSGGGTSGGNAKPGARAKTHSGTRGSSQAQAALTPGSFYPAAEHVPAGGQGDGARTDRRRSPLRRPRRW